MSKPNKEKTWSDFTGPEIDHYYRLGTDRAKLMADWAQTIWMEFAKYLLAVNAGAAAGLFLLARSEVDLLVAAFGCFCTGVFAVGVAFFASASHAIEMGKGWSKDFNAIMHSQINLGELDARHSQRCYTWKWKLARAGLVVSFICLLAGGCVAAKVFWVDKSVPKPEALAPARP